MRLGQVGQVKAGKVWNGMVRRGVFRQAWHGAARRGAVWQAGHGLVWQGLALFGRQAGLANTLERKPPLQDLWEIKYFET